MTLLVVQTRNMKIYIQVTESIFQAKNIKLIAFGVKKFSPLKSACVAISSTVVPRLTGSNQEVRSCRNLMGVTSSYNASCSGQISAGREGLTPS